MLDFWALILIQLPALCGYGAKRLLKHGNSMVQMMVDCMNSSYPCSVQMEAFKLAQFLTVGVPKLFRSFFHSILFMHVLIIR